MKTDAEALLFSVKSFAAAMLAYYISLRIGLPRPYWAIATAYIVSQPSAGASLGKGVYRLAGTITGAVATVAIVPNLVNSPMLCSIALACWIGLGLYLSLLDRTPRAYAFVLSGYTTSLIGFPSVSDPGAVFDTASLRVQEISIGILCGVLIHRLILPKRVTGEFTGKLSATLRDARQLIGDALHGAPGKESRRDRSQLAADLLALEGLATQLPYDPAPVTPQRETLRRVHDRLARLLPLATEIEDRVHTLAIQAYDPPDEFKALLIDVEAWVAATTDLGDNDGRAGELIDRARSIQDRIGTAAAVPLDRVAANLAGHLAEMIGLLHDCERLAQDIKGGGRSRNTVLHWPGAARGYVYHRDHWMAARAALGAIVGIFCGCLFWIWSAWPEGATAVSIVGVCCALFGNVDAPVRNIMQFLIGSVVAVGIAMVYIFVLLPRVTDFPVLVAVLAPAFLFTGSLLARPQTTLLAIGIILTLPVLSGLGATYTGDFAAFLNGAIAQVLGTAFAAVSMTLFQTVPVDAAISRVLRLSRRDISRRALGKARGTDEERWTSLMIDRTALLLPRLQKSGNSYSGVLDDTVHHLRIGHAVGQIHDLLPQAEKEIGSNARQLLSAIAAHFDGGQGAGPLETVDLVRRIDGLTQQVGDSAMAGRTRLIDLLIDLRFALVPTDTAVKELQT